MTFIEGLTIFNTATTLLLISLRYQERKANINFNDRSLVMLADKAPHTLKKLSARMRWTEEETKQQVAEARERLKEEEP